MFEDFEGSRVETGGAEINLVRGGDGPPVLLLHGYPQTHAMWHLVAPRLAGEFTVVAADLRGYGDSSKPEGGRDHCAYSKRAMAEDQVEVMRALGFESFGVVGHDRGARVGHRMALDHPDRVTKLAVEDCLELHTLERIGREPVEGDAVRALVPWQQLPDLLIEHPGDADVSVLIDLHAQPHRQVRTAVGDPRG